eukprot:557536-Prorocentrum_minimum.AAC.1
MVFSHWVLCRVSRVSRRVSRVSRWASRNPRSRVSRWASVCLRVQDLEYYFDIIWQDALQEGEILVPHEEDDVSDSDNDPLNNCNRTIGQEVVTQAVNGS